VEMEDTRSSVRRGRSTPFVVMITARSMKFCSPLALYLAKSCQKLAC
jgi:hypothetical protein